MAYRLVPHPTPPPEISYEREWGLDSGSALTRIQLREGMAYQLSPQLFKRRD